LFSAIGWLDVQVPDRLAAADNIRLEGLREIVLVGRYLVGDLALDDVTGCQFAIGRRYVRDDGFIVFLAGRVFQRELKQR